MYYGVSEESLKKMYVKGSLQNRDGGFTFQIKNQIDSGSMSGIAQVTVDGEPVSLNGATVELKGKVRQVDSITWSSALYVPYGAVMTLYVPHRLEPGEHTVAVKVKAPELGQLTFKIEDEVG